MKVTNWRTLIRQLSSVNRHRALRPAVKESPFVAYLENIKLFFRI